MERKIGEIFEYNGEWYQCVEGYHCYDCDFRHENGTCIIYANYPESEMGNCNGDYRTDNQNVVFKKLEKLGEPFERNGYMYQEYKTHTYPLLMSGDAKIPTDNGFAVIIKQNKEDMEEKKPTYEELLHYYHSTVGLWAIDKNPQEVSLDWICDNAFQLGIDEKHSNTEKIGKNLKAFDLQAAKSGKPVCTRDGRKARIICFDKITHKNYEEFKIIALVRDKDNEDIHVYNNEGRKYLDDSSVDLMMLPEKKEGWVNLYRDEESKRVYCGEFIFSEREKAEKHYECNDTKVATVSIGWDE